MSSCELNFDALEECLQALKHLFIDNSRLVPETRYEEKRGGYGWVQVSTLDPGTPRSKLVAAKRISLRTRHKEPQRLAFRLARELKVWAGLHHPHILPLFGYYLDEEYRTAILISEYMVYGDLRDYMDQMNPPWVSRVSLIRDLTEGLAYLHGQDPPVRHGDLKTGNVLVNVEKRAVLADFGLSKALEDLPTGLTTSDGLKGTLRYYSPELVRETDAEQALPSDIWAWACLVLEVLADKIPYAEKKSDHQVLLALMNDEPPSDAKTLSIPSLAVKRLLAHCWSIQPLERPVAKDCLRKLNKEFLSMTLHVSTDRALQRPTASLSSLPGIQSPSGVRQAGAQPPKTRHANISPVNYVESRLVLRSSPAMDTTPPTATPSYNLHLTSFAQGVTYDRNRLYDGHIKNIPESLQTANPTPTKLRRRGSVDKLIITVTSDAETHVNVDITGAKDAAFIRKRIFTRLHIPNDENCQIYHTALGEAALGDPITDHQLMISCEAWADASGTLRFFVQRNPSALPPQPRFTLPPRETSTLQIQIPPAIPAYGSPRADRDRDRSPWVSMADGYDGDVDRSNRQRYQLPAPSPATSTLYVQSPSAIPNPAPLLLARAYGCRRTNSAGSGLSRADRDVSAADGYDGDVDGSNRRKYQLPAPSRATSTLCVQTPSAIPNPTPLLFPRASVRRRSNSEGSGSSGAGRDPGVIRGDGYDGDVDGSNRRRNQLPASIDTSRRRREHSALGSSLSPFSPTSPNDPQSSMTSRIPHAPRLPGVAAAGAYLTQSHLVAYRRGESDSTAAGPLPRDTPNGHDRDMDGSNRRRNQLRIPIDDYLRRFKPSVSMADLSSFSQTPPNSLPSNSTPWPGMLSRRPSEAL